MIDLKGKCDIGDKINTQVIQPLIDANSRLAPFARYKLQVGVVSIGCCWQSGAAASELRGLIYPEPSIVFGIHLVRG